MTLENFAYYSTIITLFFAVFTYWFDFIFKKIKKRKRKIMINTEMRILYIAVRKDIIKYGAVKNNNYSESFNISHYHFPASKSIYDSGCFIDYFSTQESQAPFTIIIFLAKDLIENAHVLQRRDQKQIDWFFKNRLIELRNSLIELAEFAEFIDLRIMPERFIGDNKAPIYIDKYQEMQKEEIEAISIIKKYCPDIPINELHKQYFG